MFFFNCSKPTRSLFAQMIIIGTISLSSSIASALDYFMPEGVNINGSGVSWSSTAPEIPECPGDCGDRLFFSGALNSSSVAIIEVIAVAVGDYPANGNWCPYAAGGTIDDGGRTPDSIYIDYYSAYDVNFIHYTFSAPVLPGETISTLFLSFPDGSLAGASMLDLRFMKEDGTLTGWGGWSIELSEPVNIGENTWGGIKAMYRH